MTQLYGIIGKSLGYSYSQRYFEQKFKTEGLSDNQYLLFELKDISELPILLAKHPDMCGFNVTIPFKQTIIPFLDELSPEAAAIGAVNVVRVGQGSHLVGYNTDALGFEVSLEGLELPGRALVLGTGGAAAAVAHVLRQKDIQYVRVSRAGIDGSLTYEQITEAVAHDCMFWINCTPVGTLGFPDQLLPLPYHVLTEKHFLYDLVYNPEETPFLREGVMRGARTQNGLRMLQLQAEAAWHIWNSLEK